jgi:hypothetical protein
VTDRETRFLIVGQALEGKDVKDLLLNVGSGGGAAAAPAAGGAGGAAAADDAPAAEEKEEGTSALSPNTQRRETDTLHREGGVRRGHGLRSLRLSVFLRFFFPHLPYSGCPKGIIGRLLLLGRNIHDLSVTRHAYGSFRRIQ